MKLCNILKIWLIVIFTGLTPFLSAQNKDYSVDVSKPETFLMDAQKTIQTRKNLCFKEQSSTPLDRVSQALSEMDAKQPNPISKYWLSYADYQLAIVHQYGLKDSEKSEGVLSRGIKRLEKLPSQNSEDLALLALMKSFSIQFITFGMAKGKMSSESMSLAEKSKTLDPQNPRSYYVLGSSNFYTPKMYGGWKEVETLLTKAISLGKKQEDSYRPFQPTWGMEESYRMLLDYYNREKDGEKGKVLAKEAQQKFPNNRDINRFKKKFDTDQ